MANPFFNAMQGGNPVIQNFQNFMQQMRGKDPDAIIQDMLQSGKLTQNQYNQVRQQAQQMQGMLEGIRGMFGK